jgi:hypothetical protein
MSESDTRSLNQIRRETEQTRAALTTTVEELRGTVSDTAADIKHRLRPDTIKAEVSGYIKSRGEQLFNDMTEAARRNPMQAIAVGASIAYPAIRMVRAIPLPILMMGAGLYLAGSKTGQDLTRKASDLAAEAAEEARRRTEELRNRATELGEQATQALSDVREGALDTLGRASAMVSGTAREASGQARDLADKTSQMASRSADTAQATTSRVSEALRDTQERALDAGRDLLDSTRERFSEATDQLTVAGKKTVATLNDTVQRNPLLVVGIGLLIGGVIASVLPKSETEESLLGGASDAVKRRAQQAAAAGLEAAKGATGEILSNVAQQASAEGLSPDGLAQDVAQRIQRVAERAVTTAFDPDQNGDHKQNQSPQQNANPQQNPNRQQSENTAGGKQNG